MNNWCVDSSVVAKWVLAERDSHLALKLVEDVLSRSGRLFVLDYALLEVANVIWTRTHRKLLSSDEARQALGLLQNAAVQVESGMGLLTAALEIAIQFDVAVYDALFVAATRHVGVGGVTADEPLFLAVRAAYPEIKLLRDW
jgi:predicted nucleic acid-binding protein